MAALLLFGCLTQTFAARGEVVRFTDGRYLVVEAHRIESGYAQLKVGDESYLTVPLRKLHTIQRDDRVVFRRTLERERGEAPMSPAERKTARLAEAIQQERAALAEGGTRRAQVAAAADEWSRRFPYERALTMRPSMPVRHVVDSVAESAEMQPRQLAERVWVGSLTWRPALPPVR